MKARYNGIGKLHCFLLYNRIWAVEGGRTISDYSSSASRQLIILRSDGKAMFNALHSLPNPSGLTLAAVRRTTSRLDGFSIAFASFTDARRADATSLIPQSQKQFSLLFGSEAAKKKRKDFGGEAASKPPPVTTLH